MLWCHAAGEKGVDSPAVMCASVVNYLLARQLPPACLQKETHVSTGIVSYYTIHNSFKYPETFYARNTHKMRPTEKGRIFVRTHPC